MGTLREIKMVYTEYDQETDLKDEARTLLVAAQQARSGAHAPYSNFYVGAAVLLDNGEVVIGSNQENASYPSGLCAERVAVFQAGARFPGSVIKAIAISVSSLAEKKVAPAAPCGNCRQAILEYENKQAAPIPVYMQGETGMVISCPSINDLLPLAFTSAFL